jgi:hypothetical protein
MTIDRRALAGALATLLLVAACGGSASPAPTAEPGATQAPATEAPTTAPGAETPGAETPEPDETEGPTLQPGAAGDLEALLPSEVNGVTFEKGSFDGSTFPGGIPVGDGDDEFVQFLEDNGKSLNDVSIAVATPTSTDAGGSMVMAIQVDGMPSDKMLEWVTQDASDIEKTTIGGKEVYGAGAAGFGAYFYVKGDTVFYVLSMGGENLAEGILQQLP